ncbi:PRC-barrel domain-containing protein [Methanobacterium oryzae]|uniref:PRC-barrel domain-containing protein n=1 Tax=Methanobacterium oryzae TaxID=69540 RepID=UPI003D20E546
MDELKGKDVIDDSGDKIGEVKDVEWDPRSNRIESIILREGGVSAKVGLGEKRIVSIDKIQSIGDNVLLKTKHFMRE